MTDNTYNGWTNYATWRINLEIFDGNHETFEGCCEDSLKDYVLDEVLSAEHELTHSYAAAFLQDVNYQEIVRHINEDNEEAVS